MLKKKSAACLFFAASLYAAPAIRDIQPRGAQRGKTFTLYVRGEGLTQGAQVRSTLPASFSQLTLSKDPLSEFGGMARPNSVLPFMVALKADTPIGLYPIRVVTPDGISNVVLFSVGDLPEVEEIESKRPKEPNNFPAEAQKIPVPAVINGTLEGPDIDNYSFSAKAGQKLVFEVEARRAGSGVDPAIEIFDSSGREIARNDDAPGLGVDSRVEVTFPKSGEYRVQVHDSKFSEQAQNFYRLKIGNYPYADAIFPLGGRRGESVEVTLLGGNLPHPLKASVDLNTKSGFAFVRVPGSLSTPFLFAVSDNRETLEPESGPSPLTEDTIVNGRISKPGEIDRYTLAVEPGQKWVFEVEAASLGTSQLDAILTLYDPTGKKLVSGDDGNGADPVLPFTVPAGVKELSIAVEDLLGRGGNQFAYRLKAKQQEPDFSVDLATPFVNVPTGGTAAVVCVVQRRGYEGAMRLSIPDLPDGFHVAGGHVPPEAAAQNFNNENAGRRTATSTLTITSDANVKPQSLDLKVVAEAVTPNGVIRRTARGPGMVAAIRGDKQKPFTAPWLDMQLPMATTEALPVTVEAPTPLVRLAQGFEYTLEYRVRRKEGAKLIGRVNTVTAGAVGNLRINKGLESKNPDAGSVLLATNFATPATTFDMVLSAQAEIDGKPVTVVAPAMEVEVVPGYDIRLSSAMMEIAAGGKMEIAGKVRRELTFEGGEIRIAVEDLPDQVQCPAVTVPADQQDFTLRCAAGADAKSGAFPIRIASAAPDTGRKAKAEYKIPDVEAKLVVGDAAKNAVANRREP
jgi:hypothetical protein